MTRDWSRIHLLLVFIVSLPIIGCVAASDGASRPASDDAFVVCPEQRTTSCTREFDPVCATRDTGIRCIKAPCPSSEQITRDNACTACADVAVSGYVPGACATLKDEAS